MAALALQGAGLHIEAVGAARVEPLPWQLDLPACALALADPDIGDEQRTANARGVVEHQRQYKHAAGFHLGDGVLVEIELRADADVAAAIVADKPAALLMRHATQQRLAAFATENGVGRHGVLIAARRDAAGSSDWLDHQRLPLATELFAASDTELGLGRVDAGAFGALHSSFARSDAIARAGLAASAGRDADSALHTRIEHRARLFF